MGKSKYESHVKPKLALIEGWYRNGLTLEQIAENLGVSYYSFCKYRDSHVELLDTLKASKEVADIQVENALYRNATGYYYTEEVLSNAGIPIKVEKYQHPNTTAQIFWLKNRDPAKWRDKQEIKHDIDVSLGEVLTKAWERMNDD